MDTQYDLDSVIRKVPDFPKEGVLFYDITGILAVPEAFRFCIDRLEELCKDRPLDAIAGIEARGFVFAAPLAERLGVPLALVRKLGKLPGKSFKKSFELEYGSDTVCVHEVDVVEGSKVLLVDDLIATGGTLKAAAALFEEHGAQVVGFLGVIGLPFLNYEDVLKGYPVDVLLEYKGE
ncbi:adenine phosphoribosyltransferase [uncultured Sphaerochaeta sp.]|uniref:adenine phosphoribosyltransferase n=1 Tax=uncultured Sphaerochaeta sp. TaxID=886478 RepID=UPI002A0A62E6|nr:adenine phosphoribosyltransferase [uncultured Sphaerochaeta sp.]